MQRLSPAGAGVAARQPEDTVHCCFGQGQLKRLVYKTETQTDGYGACQFSEFLPVLTMAVDARRGS